MSDRTNKPRPPAPGPEVMQRIRDAICATRYGHVVVIIQNGQVVQIDRLEKERLNNDPAGS